MESGRIETWKQKQDLASMVGKHGSGLNLNLSLGCWVYSVLQPALGTLFRIFVPISAILGSNLLRWQAVGSPLAAQTSADF